MKELPNGDKLLNISDVASYLGICRENAVGIVLELPHVDASITVGAKKKMLLILESVLMDYVAGKIQRAARKDRLPRPSEMKTPKKSNGQMGGRKTYGLEYRRE